MRFKKRNKEYKCSKVHYDQDFAHYLKNKKITVVAIDGGKGNYITAPSRGGQFSNLFTVINGLPITAKVIIVDIEIMSTNYRDGVVTTLFAKAVSEPIEVKETKLLDSSWSGSGLKYLINNSIEFSTSSYDVVYEILNTI